MFSSGIHSLSSLNSTWNFALSLAASEGVIDANRETFGAGRLLTLACPDASSLSLGVLLSSGVTCAPVGFSAPRPALSPLTTDGLSSLTDSLSVLAVGLSSLAGDGLSVLAGDGLSSLAGDGLSVLIGDCLSSLIGDCLSSLIGDCLSSLTGDCLSSLIGDCLSSLTGDGLSSLAGDGLSSLAGDGLSSLAGDGLSSLAGDGLSVLAGEDKLSFTFSATAGDEGIPKSRKDTLLRVAF